MPQIIITILGYALTITLELLFEMIDGVIKGFISWKNLNNDYLQVALRNDMLTGGVYQLRQGQQRRLAVRVKPAQNSGTLPIICQHIVSVEVGSVTVR